MKATLLFTALLLTALAFQIQTNPPSPSTALVPSNDEGFIWVIQRNIMKGAPTLGFYVNKTIYAFPTLDPIPGITVPNPKPTQLYFQIFDLLPVVRGKLDNDAFLVKVPPMPFLYLVNPDQGTKWQMWNVSHAYLYGIDESKALIVNDEYLNRFPTEYVF